MCLIYIVSDNEDVGYVIRAPVTFELADFDCGEATACFSSNAGKLDKKLSAPFSCTCKVVDGQPCYQQFRGEELVDIRMYHLSMTKDELDIAILGQLKAFLNNGPLTCNTKRCVNTPRQKGRSQYRLNGDKVCRDLFEYLHGVGSKKT